MLTGNTIQCDLGTFGQNRIPLFKGVACALLSAVALTTSRGQVTNGPVAAIKDDTPPAGIVARPTEPNPKLPVLREIIQVRELSPQEASRGYPVAVEAMVTYHDDPSYLHFIQDNSAGIYLDLGTITNDAVLKCRQKIAVIGFSGPGDYAPIIHAQDVRVIGEGEYPAPKSSTSRMLMTGAEDSQWVSLKGVIRSKSTDTNQTVLSLSTMDMPVDLVVPQSAGPPSQDKLIDAAVEVHGVCATLFNEHRRLIGVKVCVPEWAQLEIKEAAPDNPFKLPLRPIDDLFQFQPSSSRLHRVHLKGCVVRRQQDGSFFLQQGQDGLFVRPRVAGRFVEVGTLVEVVGFPAISDRLPTLQEALVKAVGQERITPALPKPEKLLDDELHATLVTVQGRVLGRSDRPTEDLLTVQCGQHVVDALLDKTAESSLPHAVAGSIVELTGVYVALLDAQKRIQSFQLLLRTPADVVLLSSPSWWTAWHTVWVLAGLGTVLLSVLAWVALLRRQVRQRTRELRAEIEEKKRAEESLKTAQGDLLLASRLAGMAEVATSVLHNVGNVLNSVNVSANLIFDQIKHSKLGGIRRVAGLLQEHANHLGQFLSQDPKGKQLPAYLEQLGEHLAREQSCLLQEVESLRKNVGHIKTIVATQQSYARVAGVTESISVPELIEDALKVNEAGLARHEIRLVRDYGPELPVLSVDKNKVLQILVNLIRNAKHACEDSARQDKSVTVRATNGAGRLQIAIIDNGIGIPAENLTRIFNHGFTTRKNGHGFGLHSGALAAKELGGVLMGQSEGPGKGATFTLEIPVASNN